MSNDQTAPTLGKGPVVPALEARNLAKSFGGVRALKGVDLAINGGEVVALLGENGSGKSTLVKILSGYHEPAPGGELLMSGQPVPLPVPLGGARAFGLAFVYQDLGLAPDLQVVENLFVGHRVAEGLGSFTRIKWAAERERARTIFRSYGVQLDPSAQVGRLRPTSQALLAIVRAAEELREYREARDQTGGVLILDEPTVFLPESEKVFLFDLVRRVTSEGLGVLFVSHDMTAVREIADRAVVLRDGEKVGDVTVQDASDADLIELVSGHRLDRAAIELATTYGSGGTAGPTTAGSTAAGPTAAGPTAAGLTAAGSTAAGPTADEPQGDILFSARSVSGGRVRDMTFDLHAGEIVGVAGLLGAGSEDLPYVLFGDVAGASGEIAIGDWSGQVSDLTPGRAIELGVALVPADRKQQGAVADLTVGLNMLSLSLSNFVQGGFLRVDKLIGTANRRVETYDVRPRDATLNMAALSGGNQQKVVLARWLEQSPRILLLHEPTQGVDVATRQQIYQLMRARADQGVAILWVSTDFDELATVCHRILLCAQGQITGAITPPYSRDRITSEVYSATARGPASEVYSATARGPASEVYSATARGPAREVEAPS